jgi:hypothetical protein
MWEDAYARFRDRGELQVIIKGDIALCRSFCLVDRSRCGNGEPGGEQPLSIRPAPISMAVAVAKVMNLRAGNLDARYFGMASLQFWTYPRSRSWRESGDCAEPMFKKHTPLQCVLFFIVLAMVVVLFWLAQYSEKASF